MHYGRPHRRTVLQFLSRIHKAYILISHINSYLFFPYIGDFVLICHDHVIINQYIDSLGNRDSFLVSLETRPFQNKH